MWFVLQNNSSIHYFFKFLKMLRFKHMWFPYRTYKIHSRKNFKLISSHGMRKCRINSVQKQLLVRHKLIEVNCTWVENKIFYTYFYTDQIETNAIPIIGKYIFQETKFLVMNMDLSKSNMYVSKWKSERDNGKNSHGMHWKFFNIIIMKTLMQCSNQ